MRQVLDELLANPATAETHLAPDCVWDAAHPVNQLVGPEAVRTGFLEPLRAAMPHVHRRDIMFLGGTSRLHERGQWVACMTHYVGTMTGPLFGMEPSGSMIYLRSGEFYRLDDSGRIAESKIIFDVIDVMRQVWRLPIPSLGDEITFPAPITQDGLCPAPRPDRDAFDVVDKMMEGLGKYTPGTWSSEGQTGEDGVWADDMLWYGPAGIGSNYMWDGFVQDHRAPFLISFPDRKGGHHFCRFGDGDYAAMGGWPSIHATFVADYLGVKATGGPITMRVMDFYRLDDRDKLSENWVFIDLAELFFKAGRDLIAESNAMGGKRPMPQG